MHGHAGRNGGCGNAAGQHICGGTSFVGRRYAVERRKAVKTGRCLVHAQHQHGQAEQHKAAGCQRIGGQQAGRYAEQGAALQAACSAQALHPAGQLADGYEVADDEQCQRQSG